MDQQRLKRLLRLLLMLAGKRWYSLNEILATLETTERTAYRYLETFETIGFLLERNNGLYRLRKDTSSRSLQNLIHFSDEEVFILYETLSLVEGTSTVKEQLIRKLNVLYDIGILSRHKNNDDLMKIQQLSDAIRSEKQVVFKNYRSSNSNKITDRKVEPFDFLPDYRAVWCYEYESKSCKQFKLARIHQIESLIYNWQNKEKHQVNFTDAFRISAAKPIANVQARLSLKAYNLLIEEFPLSRNYITGNNGTYQLKIPIAGFNGIGRFVLGLPGEITVQGTAGFKAFLNNERKKFTD